MRSGRRAVATPRLRTLHRQTFLSPSCRLSTLVLVVCLGILAAAPSAKELYKRGRKYEKQKDYANAYLMYSEAAAADPSKREYWRRAQALQRRALTDGNVVFNNGSPATALDADPESLPPPIALPEDLEEARKPEPPVEIKAGTEKHDIDLRGDDKALWEQVTKLWGLDVIFEGDFQAGQPRKFRLMDVGYREALHSLMTATGTFFVPMSQRLMLIVKDTEQKRKEVENTVVLSVPIPEPFSVQEAQELGRTVQQVMEIQRFAIDSAQRLVIFRDRVSKARPAQVLFSQLLQSRAQVNVEFELMSAAKTSTLGLGLSVPATFPITALEKMMTLKGPLPQFALAVTGANLLARATKSEARTLFRADLLSVDGQAASLKVGEKYPIMTLGYVGTVPDGQQAFAPPPSFTFEDLGLNIKVTPKVHDQYEVTLEVEAEFKVISGTGTNGIPVISNRKFVSRSRLRFDQAAVISGLVSRNHFKTYSGPAGIPDIPLLGSVLGTALGQSNWSDDSVQILLVMRPRLITLPPTEAVVHPIWIGSESRPRIPL